ncbi:hypothetical protein NOVA_03950 [Nocardia nova]|uniref:hypothetical protein n=1 Tax=Nocardia nova TaxID=37330 RepID=UPI001C446380|nr:hypothetical protein [Nocardia nova]MBV7701914.1 hypothetical protein [Nocardia nova]
MSECHRNAVAVQLHQRASAARRLPTGDPWLSDRPVDMSARELSAWCEAVNCIAEQKVTPIVPLPVLRAMYRAGGSVRALAARVYRAGGAAA